MMISTSSSEALNCYYENHRAATDAVDHLLQLNNLQPGGRSRSQHMFEGSDTTSDEDEAGNSSVPWNGEEAFPSIEWKSSHDDDNELSMYSTQRTKEDLHLSVEYSPQGSHKSTVLRRCCIAFQHDLSEIASSCGADGTAKRPSTGATSPTLPYLTQGCFDFDQHDHHHHPNGHHYSGLRMQRGV